VRSGSDACFENTAAALVGFPSPQRVKQGVFKLAAHGGQHPKPNSCTPNAAPPGLTVMGLQTSWLVHF
jgi:hypothetical protein